MRASTRWYVFLAMLLMLFAGRVVTAEVLYSELTPNGQYRLEISDREFNGVYEVYRCRPWQPPECFGWKLSGVSMIDWDVWSFTISPDSLIVVSRKGCLTCYNGTSQWRYVVASIDLQSIEWVLPDIFIDGFESGGVTRWN